MTYLLDTDHISILGRTQGPLHRALVARLAAVPESEIGFPIISYHEQLLGCHKFIQAARTPDQMVRGYELLEDLRRLFATAQIVPFDAAAAAECSRHSPGRLRVGTMDLRIASIAIAHGLTLLTRNSADFSRIPGLLHEDWTAP
ncbi:type II toxin-antitoxin system VapC family toxin [Planctomicrobium piriforme]|uniref:tRNA(fMet)-specific endonuclease VapC n=1 Tax=Planctomicrobium piriforme TaxID=1576369 RepID=A0A1I3FXR5_9PLAN|nr:tRNA(fMet)-specific endonuclease VapC [Planctomicrobium piriforme]